MRNPEKVLNSLAEHSKDLNYKFERLYRILFNAEMFYVAYENIHSKQGNMTKGTDGQTADQMSIARIERLITSLRGETYKPHPSRRVYILKKNGKKRPLGIPSFDDKLVQEVIRMMLEAIYEGSFEKTSHGFRPYKSCHTALSKIQDTFTGTRWFIEGDIKGFFDNINHEVLIGVLKERIEDERFIRLIRKFLNAGYMERWKFHNTYSGTPQGGIISPILANIYLDRFDKFMEEYRQKFDKGKRRKSNNSQNKVNYRIKLLRQKLNEAENETEKKELLKTLKEAIKERLKIATSFDQMDSEYRRIKYIRYADDFLISVIGSKEESEQIKADITKYLAQTLKLELSDEKTLITNAKRPAKFLGFDVVIRKVNVVRRNSKGFLSRPLNDKVVILVTPDIMRRKLQEYDVVKMVTHKGTEKWKPKVRTKFINLELADIVSKFNSEIRGFYNYYSIANNSNYLYSFYYIMRFSLYKTFAAKLRSSTFKILTKYCKNGEFSVEYKGVKGKTLKVSLYKAGFRRKIGGFKSESIDVQPNRYVTAKTGLYNRLVAGVCEMCGTKGELIVHQVRALKALKGNVEWEKLMIKRNRKTLVVCNNCNHKIQQYQADNINGEPYTLRGVRTVRGQVPANLPQ